MTSRPETFDPELLAQKRSTLEIREETDRRERGANYEIQQIPSIGLGTVSLKDYQEGEVISHYIIGPEDRAQFAEFDTLTPEEDMYSIQIDVSPSGKGLYYHTPSDSPRNFVNHSCDPNAGLRFVTISPEFTDSQLFAIRPIKPGEHVTIDYSTTQLEDRKSLVDPCQCGSEHCRKSVRPFPELPPDLQKRYLALGAVLPFIADAAVNAQTAETGEALRSALPDHEV